MAVIQLNMRENIISELGNCNFLENKECLS